MNTRLPEILVALSAAVLVSCAGDPSSEGADVGSGKPQEAFRVKSGEMFDDDSQAILGRYGSSNPKMSGKEASESGAGDNKQFEGRFANREFATSEREEKASLWGSKEYAAQVYDGNLDGSRHQTAARMADKGAREGTLISREGGRVYQAPSVSRTVAREDSGGEIRRTSDAETDARRRVFPQPVIEDWRPQRALTVEDTKGMLGR